MFNLFIRQLQYALSLPLPGTAIQLTMAPAIKRNFNLAMKKQASVLILLYEENNDPHFPLLIRNNKGVHGGQIALPGGKREPSDKDAQETALREAEEETLVTPFGRIYHKTSTIHSQP